MIYLQTAYMKNNPVFNRTSTVFVFGFYTDLITPLSYYEYSWWINFAISLSVSLSYHDTWYIIGNTSISIEGNVAGFFSTHAGMYTNTTSSCLPNTIIILISISYMYIQKLHKQIQTHQRGTVCFERHFVSLFAV